MFSGLFNANGNSNNNNGVNNNNNNNNDFNNNGNYVPVYPQTNSNMDGPIQSGVRTVGAMVRPIIDSIFDVSISKYR